MFILNGHFYWKLADIAYETKVMDSLQFIESADQYLYHANLYRNSFTNLKRSQEKEIDGIKEKALKEGSAAFKGIFSKGVDFYGQNIDGITALDMMARNFFQALTDFLDNYAQFLNRAFLAEKAYSTKGLDFGKLYRNLKNQVANYQSMPEAVEVMDQYFDLHDLKQIEYLRDINNTLKHRRIINVTPTVDILGFIFEIMIKGFEKDGRNHPPRHLQDVINELNDIVTKFYFDCTQKVIKYLQKFGVSRATNRTHDVFSKSVSYSDNSGDIKDTVIQYIEVDFSVNPGDEIAVLSVAKDDEKYDIKNTIAEDIVIEDMNNNIISVMQSEEPITIDKDTIQLYEYRNYKVLDGHPMPLYFEVLKKYPRKVMVRPK